MNWHNYRIVKFNNGMFGIRKGWLFHEFYYKNESDMWCIFPDFVLKYSANMTEQEANDYLDKLISGEFRKYYEVIK